MAKESRIEALLQGQTSIARKIYEFVPIGEDWTEFQIVAEMRRVTGSVPDLKVARGCLRDLADAGLIVRRNDQHRRTPTQEKTQQKEVAMPAVTHATQAAKVAAAQSPIDLLGDIAGSIVALSKSVGEQLQQLANRVEDAALQIEQGQEANAANLEKLRQLQSLLRSIGEGA